MSDASVSPAAAAEIARWVSLELSPWQDIAFDADRVSGALRAQAEAHMSVFLFRLESGRIILDDKSSGYSNPPPGEYARSLTYRGVEYRDFLQQVVDRFGITGNTVLALELEDIGQPRFSVPVFAFQKHRGANTMLLPDVDFLSNDFFKENRATDPQSFDDKLSEAIFAGSTTGIPCMTAADVHGKRNHRLRSACYFRSIPGVVFDLPNIVQYDSNETRSLIEALGVAGRTWSWADQAQRKYLISMDGNGATCARVVLSLLNNSVLLKYNSPYLLYYFHGLDPWRHYIPVMRDQDISVIIENSKYHSRYHSAIAERSRSFALDYLSRDAVMLYTAQLLRGYLALTAGRI